MNQRPTSTSASDQTSRRTALADLDALVGDARRPHGRLGVDERRERRLTELFGLVMMLCTLLAVVSALLAAHAVTEAQHGLIGFAVLGLVTAGIVHRAARAWLGEELEVVGRDGGLGAEAARHRARERVTEIETRRGDGG